MIVGQRILARLEVVKISQSELARRVRMSQGAMANLIAGRSRSSTHLHKIARELQTTPSYLSGETDDPEENAPPPPAPPPPIVTMEVVLPHEAALEHMFEALLGTIDEHASRAELAQLLAQRLPIGLSQLRDLRQDSAGSPASRARRAAARSVALPSEPEPAS